jgi:hypothetical protein
MCRDMLGSAQSRQCRSTLASLVNDRMSRTDASRDRLDRLVRTGRESSKRTADAVGVRTPRSRGSKKSGWRDRVWAGAEILY